jgi:uncharacterized membrane protein
MTADNANAFEPTIFSAVITPHRSLGPGGFFVLMIVFGGISFIYGIIFLAMGAWPVFGFFGLEAVFFYCAFRLNYRHARAYEEVTVTPSTLIVRKINHRGNVREWVLNPLWVKLEPVTHEEFGIEHLLLVSRGQRLAIANFLSPDERVTFADAIGAAISQAKRGITGIILQ